MDNLNDNEEQARSGNVGKAIEWILLIAVTVILGFMVYFSYEEARIVQKSEMVQE